MIEIYTCDQCGNTHQKYIKLQKVEISNKTKPKYFDTIDCVVNFLLESGWKQYKLDCTVQKDVITIINQLNEKRKQQAERGEDE